MRLRASKTGVAALVLALALPVVAEAGSRRAPRVVEEYREPAYAESYAGRCSRWCDRDFTPCDPAHFKIADGRCAALPSYTR